MNYLKPAVFAVEGVVVGTCATAAWQIATMHGGDPWACAPVATIAAMECLRVPLAMSLPKLKFAGISFAVLTMAARWASSTTCSTHNAKPIFKFACRSTCRSAWNLA